MDNSNRPRQGRQISRWRDWRRKLEAGDVERMTDEYLADDKVFLHDLGSKYGISESHAARVIKRELRRRAEAAERGDLY